MDELDYRIRLLRKLIQEDMSHPKVRILAQQITKDYHTNLGKARAIYNWIKQNIRYTREPDGMDVYLSPSRTIELGRGDCDEAASLFATLAGIVGVPVKLKVVAQRPDLWSHIYPIASTNGHWTVFDAAAPVLPGHEVTYLKAREFNV